MKLTLHPGFFVVTSFAFGLPLLITFETLNASYEWWVQLVIRDTLQICSDL